MELFAVEVAGAIEPRLVGEEPDVDHERVAFPPAARIAHPEFDRQVRMPAAIGEDLTNGVQVFVEDDDAVRQLKNLKWVRHIGDARHARQIALCLGICRHPILVVLSFLFEGPRHVRNVVPFHDSLTCRHTEPGWQSRESSTSMVLDVPCRGVEDLPYPLQIRPLCGRLCGRGCALSRRLGHER